MRIYFQKHNFKPKEKLTAQMLNELESFVFELLLSKTYSLTSPVEITENTEYYGTPNASDPFLNAALSLNNVVGVSFDGTPYICPVVELPDIGFVMGNIKAFFEQLALDDADMVAQLKSALDQKLAYLVDRENNIPVVLFWDSEGSLQVCKVEDNKISMSPFGTHSLNILLADLTHSDMKALPDIKILNNGDIGFDKNESYPIQGLTMEVWFELMRYAEILVKADRHYCLMSYHDALGGISGIDGVYEGFIVTPIGEKTSYVFVAPDGSNTTDLPNELIYKGTYTQ